MNNEVKLVAHFLPIGKRNLNGTIISKDCKITTQTPTIPVKFGQDGPVIGTMDNIEKTDKDIVAEVHISNDMLIKHKIDIDFSDKVRCGSMSIANVDKEINESGETINIVKSADIKSLAIFNEFEIPASDDTYIEVIKNDKDKGE